VSVQDVKGAIMLTSVMIVKREDLSQLLSEMENIAASDGRRANVSVDELIQIQSKLSSMDTMSATKISSACFLSYQRAFGKKPPFEIGMYPNISVPASVEYMARDGVAHLIPPPPAVPEQIAPEKQLRFTDAVIDCRSSYQSLLLPNWTLLDRNGALDLMRQLGGLLVHASENDTLLYLQIMQDGGRVIVSDTAYTE